VLSWLAVELTAADSSSTGSSSNSSAASRCQLGQAELTQFVDSVSAGSVAGVMRVSASMLVFLSECMLVPATV
jgi:hypothetical protein